MSNDTDDTEEIDAEAHLADIAVDAILGAQALPRETKRLFWGAVLKGATLGDAKDQAGIENTMVATHLMIQLLEIDYVMGLHNWETNGSPGSFEQFLKVKR